MIYLFVSIIFTSFIYIIFRAFSRFNVDPMPAIVFNYLARVIIGFFIEPQSFFTYVHKAPPVLLMLCVFTGVAFIAIFSLISRATRIMGVTSTTIVSRMSMVIPAGFSIIYYHESLGLMKVVGILMALIAIYFTVYEKKIEEIKEKKSKVNKTALLVPIFLFLGSGLADMLLKISQKEFMMNKLDYVYIDILYSVSALTGIIVLIVTRTSLKTIFRRQNLIWGIILGADNYIALLLFLLALTKGNMQGSQVFPINSVGIVLFSTLFAIIFYKEKLKGHRILGLALAVCAILIISLSA